MTEETVSPTTLVLGASANPTRYSYLATQRLLNRGHRVCLVGARPGVLLEHVIHTDLTSCEAPVDTVTLYVGAARHGDWTEEFRRLGVRRVVVNPGTEHPALEDRLRDVGLEVIRGCTLVMLASGTY